MEAGKGEVKEAAQVPGAIGSCSGPLQELMLLWLKSFLVLFNCIPSAAMSCSVSVTNTEQCILQELRLLFAFFFSLSGPLDFFVLVWVAVFAF